MANSSSNIFSVVLSLAVLSFTGWYGFTHFQTLTEVKANTLEADTVLFDLENEKVKVESEYEKNRATYMTQLSENLASIESVLPPGEDVTTLTRALDEFSFLNHNMEAGEPFFISQLSYGDLLDKDDYRVLPITMAVETSEDNFHKFLEYVENSGSLDTGNQLLSIDSIALQEADGEALRVQISLYAYLQKL